MGPDSTSAPDLVEHAINSNVDRQHRRLWSLGTVTTSGLFYQPRSSEGQKVHTLTGCRVGGTQNRHRMAAHRDGDPLTGNRRLHHVRQLTAEFTYADSPGGMLCHWPRV